MWTTLLRRLTSNAIWPDPATCQAIRQQVAALPYDFANYHLPTFIAALNKTRSRPICWIPFPTQQPQPIGLWYHQAHQDTVVVSAGPQFHPLLLDHISLHEIAHILLGHSPIPLHQLALPSAATPPQLGRQWIFHADHLTSTAQEREAEYMATQMQARWIQAQAQQQTPTLHGLHAITHALALMEPH